jgi:hypothetical protein
MKPVPITAAPMSARLVMRDLIVLVHLGWTLVLSTTH